MYVFVNRGVSPTQGILFKSYAWPFFLPCKPKSHPLEFASKAEVCGLESLIFKSTAYDKLNDNQRMTI